MKIYTKTGDKGETSLFGGARVSKSHDRIEAYGTVDELNSYIGLLRDQEINKSRKDLLKEIQDILFTIGSSLAADPTKQNLKAPVVVENDVLTLEKDIDEMQKNLPDLRNFILPGGSEAISFCHIARCVCRRAERRVIALSEKEHVEEIIIKYLNRLSDHLFVLSRMMGKEAGIDEVIWKARN